MGKYHGLSVEEERDLFDRAQGGDRAARDELLLRHDGLACAMAAKYSRYDNGFLTTDDLQQEARIGLHLAFNNFDLTRGTRFNTYARWWVRHRLQKAGLAARATASLPGGRHMRKVRNRGARTRVQLRHVLGREPSREELAEALEVPVRAVETSQALGQPALTIEAERDVWAETPVSERDRTIILRAGGDVAEEVERREMVRWLARAMRRLSPRDQLILQRRFVDEATLDTIGKELGVTRERIRQLEARALRQLREFFTRVRVLPSMRAAA